jgi:hypothetical protein
MQPAIALPNTALETRGWGEVLNAAYGMGRQTASYRGHLMTSHGGDLPGFHTQVSFMPQDHIGVIVFEIGNHSQPLYNIVSYNVYERLLGMDLTPWSDRQLEIRLKNKKAGTEARTKAAEGKVPSTKPSHALADYVASYENPAYGTMKIGLKDNQLQFDFHKVRMALSHYHYDRFDTADDEEDGKWSVNFRTSPQGEIDQAVMSLDEAEVIFSRKPDPIAPVLLSQLAGSYDTPGGVPAEIKLAPDGAVLLISGGGAATPLVHVNGLIFRHPRFSDVTFEFVAQDGRVRGLRQRNPSSEFTFPKK